MRVQLLSKAGALRALPASYNGMQIYADLSQYTLKLRRQLKTVIKALNNYKIAYKCCHPAPILAIRNAASHMIYNLKD